MTIFVNDKAVVFAEHETFRTAAQIKARAGADIQRLLMKESPPNEPDKFVGDSETIRLEDEDRFILVPQCGF